MLPKHDRCPDGLQAQELAMNW